MYIRGLDYLHSLLDQEYYSAKMVLNAHGVIFFSVHQEHRSQNAENISYADDYKGNAMAAMLSPKKIEARYHKAFTDRQVAEIISAIKQQPELGFMTDWNATYQGRSIDV